MSGTTTLLVLLVAALLEAGGDAIVRYGLHRNSVGMRIGLFGVGALVLFGYGIVVNSPPWDFGRLLGIYVVFFFLVAQAISWLFFAQRPSVAVWAGGALIVVGGAVIAAFQ